MLQTRPTHDLAADRLRYPTAQRGAFEAALFFTVNLPTTVTQNNSFGDWTPPCFWADQAVHTTAQLKAKFSYCTWQQASARLPLKLHYNGVWRASECVRRLLVLHLFPKLKQQLIQNRSVGSNNGRITPSQSFCLEPPLCNGSLPTRALYRIPWNLPRREPDDGWEKERHRERERERWEIITRRVKTTI